MLGKDDNKTEVEGIAKKRKEKSTGKVIGKVNMNGVADFSNVTIALEEISGSLLLLFHLFAWRFACKI